MGNKELENQLPEASLPDYEANNHKLRNQFPTLYLPDLYPPSDCEETLNKVARGWYSGEKIYQETLGRYTKALALPNIPKLEMKDVGEYQTKFKSPYPDFIQGVTEISNGEKLKWKRVEELAELGDKIAMKGNAKDEQAIALLHAISETHKEGRTPEEIRQKIAQHAFNEIYSLGKYRILEWTGAEDGEPVGSRTTQDELSEEKDELVSALKANLWDAAKTEEMAKVYKDLRRVAKSDDNRVDISVIDELEKLWNATQGKGLTKKSSLEILQLAENIYESYEKGGAFDIDLKEYPIKLQK